jgi:hypothetical protein
MSDSKSIDEEIAAFDAFAKDGDYFSARSYSDNLTETDALEVLSQEADGTESIVLYAWKREVVGEQWKASMAKELVEAMLESFDDEDGFGPVDDATELSKEAAIEVAAKARELVDLFVSKAHVWRCQQTTECELSAEAVRAIFEREGLT